MNSPNDKLSNQKNKKGNYCQKMSHLMVASCVISWFIRGGGFNFAGQQHVNCTPHKKSSDYETKAFVPVLIIFSKVQQHGRSLSIIPLHKNPTRKNQRTRHLVEDLLDPCTKTKILEQYVIRNHKNVCREIQ